MNLETIYMQTSRKRNMKYNSLCLLVFLLHSLLWHGLGPQVEGVEGSDTGRHVCHWVLADVWQLHWLWDKVLDFLYYRSTIPNVAANHIKVLCTPIYTWLGYSIAFLMHASIRWGNKMRTPRSYSNTLDKASFLGCRKYMKNRKFMISQYKLQCNWTL